MAAAEQLIETAGLETDILKLVRGAFDGVWTAISGNYSTPPAIETARLRLANAVLDIAVRGGRDLDLMKAAGLQSMQELRLPQAHRS